MKRLINSLVAASALVMILNLPEAQAVPPVWDNFRGKVINSGRWLGGRVDPGAIEIRRYTKNTGLQLRLRGIGDHEATSGERQRVLNRLWMSKTSAAQTARSMQTYVRVNNVDIQECTDAGAPESIVEYRNTNTWFNDGRSSASGDRLGDVFTYIGLRKSALNGLEANQLEIVALVGLCSNDDCTSSTKLYSDTLGVYPVGTNVALRTTWDDLGHQLRFFQKQKNTDAVVLTYNYADDVTVAGDPGARDDEMHHIQLRTETADCDLATSGSERPFGLIDATVWNTRLSDSAVGN